MRRAWMFVGIVPLGACAAVLGLDSGDPRGDAGGGPGGDGAPGSDGAIVDATAGADSTDGVVDPPDAGHGDAAPPPDSAPPPRVEPSIVCGTATCVPNVSKCVTCGTGPLGCQPWNAPLSGCNIMLCDDTADCSGTTPDCCARPPGARPDVVSTASCRLGCGTDVKLCDPDKPDCVGVATCKPYANMYACQ